ncbi:MAG: hypothetical protein Q8P86_02745 [bacterium]|nr:hypothetical protein [bacterium]
MFNLLTKEEKRSLRKEYRLRLAVVVLWFSFITGVLGLVFLVPVYVVSLQKEEISLANYRAVEESLEIKNEEELSLSLQDAELKLNTLLDNKEEVSVHDFLSDILNIKGDDIKIYSLTMLKSKEKKKEEKHELMLSGVAANRAGLVEFANSLENHLLIREVELPISNFAKENDIEFMITIPLGKI